MEQIKPKTRFEEIDFIRMIVVFSVIGIHVSADYVLVSFYGNVWNKMMSNAVHIFLMLSGFGLMYSEMKKNTNYFTFLTKRVPKIVFPYIVWNIAYFFIKIYLYGFQGNDQGKMSQLIHGIAFSEIMYHLYFLIILFFLYLLFPMLKNMVMNFPKVTVVFSILAFGFSIKYAQFLQDTLGVYGFYQPLLWTVYFVGGMLLAVHLTKIHKIAETYKWIWFVVWAGMFYVMYQKNTKVFLEAIPGQYIHIIYVLASFIALFGLASMVYRKKQNGFFIVRFISKHSFLIYLSHPLVLIIWGNIMLRHPEWNELFLHGTGMAIKYIIVVIATIILTLVLSILPGRSLFGGVKPWNDKKKTKNVQTNVENKIEQSVKKETV